MKDDYDVKHTHRLSRGGQKGTFLPSKAMSSNRSNSSRLPTKIFTQPKTKNFSGVTSGDLRSQEIGVPFPIQPSGIV